MRGLRARLRGRDDLEPLSDLTPRLSSRPGVESWFLRANHPTRPLAIWLKTTVLIPRKGKPITEAWACLFDRESGRAWGAKVTEGLDHQITGSMSSRVGGCEMDLRDAGGAARGHLSRDGLTARWDLSWERVAGPLGDPLCFLPSRRMLADQVPTFKLVTPTPAAVFSGRIWVDDQPIDVDGWHGMVGHNWGRKYTHAYAWGQVLFTDGAGQPFCMAEGCTAQVKLAGVLTPPISCLVVRRQDQEYRFDNVLALWRQRAHRDDLHWSVRLSGPDGEALLSMRAAPSDVVTLGYVNPDGRLSYCLNSKLAHAVLRVNPTNGDGFECVSESGGALEFLQPTADARLPGAI